VFAAGRATTLPPRLRLTPAIAAAVPMVIDAVLAVLGL